MKTFKTLQRTRATLTGSQAWCPTVRLGSTKKKYGQEREQERLVCPTLCLHNAKLRSSKSRTMDKTETVNVGDPVFENVLKVGREHGWKRLELCTTNNKA